MYLQIMYEMFIS